MANLYRQFKLRITPKVSLINVKANDCFLVSLTRMRTISYKKVYLSWRDADPIKIKYAFFYTKGPAATLHVCGRTGKAVVQATN